MKRAVAAMMLSSIALLACSPADQPEPPPAEAVKGTTPPPSAVDPSVPQTPAAAAEALNSAGLGAVRIGMTEQEAIAAYGKPMTPPTASMEGSTCRVARPQDPAAGLLFLFQERRLDRITIQQTVGGPMPTLKTDRGIGLGATEADVKRAYGQSLAFYPGKYATPGSQAKDATHWDDAAQTRGVRFETGDDGRVRSIHAGNKAIELVEGCS
jgi:hypothetical protein